MPHPMMPTTAEQDNLTVNSVDSLDGNHVPLLPHSEIPASPTPTFAVTVEVAHPILTVTDTFAPVAPATTQAIVALITNSSGLIDFYHFLLSEVF
ncbi:hypothetical protein BC937DRAFT_87562 [Endogone sp. FLAS-F59071]|nr:hypothetical protein BC937DRAFT_87562 [Endogone sp. FLAS-F59071]|eukprot:RUS19396.1 hypothetical protein BC937DRAFT_87562 [Endogone sp. FLAS-F59071]